MRSKCREIAEMHISEFPSIAPVLERDMGGTLPRVSTFQHLATVLTEDGEHDRAIEVCELGRSFGLHDGTRGDFEGCIDRIKKKQIKAPLSALPVDGVPRGWLTSLRVGEERLAVLTLPFSTMTRGRLSQPQDLTSGQDLLSELQSEKIDFNLRLCGGHQSCSLRRLL